MRPLNNVPGKLQREPIRVHSKVKCEQPWPRNTDSSYPQFYLTTWQQCHKVFTVTEQGKSVVKVPSNTLVEH